ncbi:hypothetical protein HZH66_014883 [Vespula vulgaris]|uniref:Uncharacterized protein n=2 Tax=Vespula TaxID=7451 RepID=A0A834JLU5_VESPE|nr:hypothetical protein HZH66_014883 [Vespula vulgaris]KAF7390564.1 hypothetical protein H0235_017726 [Vespula pensylvanica]
MNASGASSSQLLSLLEEPSLEIEPHCARGLEKINGTGSCESTASSNPQAVEVLIENALGVTIDEVVIWPLLM